MMSIADRCLSEEQRMMRETCRAFVDDFVAPFVRQKKLAARVEHDARGAPAFEHPRAGRQDRRQELGVPEAFGGTPIDPREEVQTFAIIAEEIARGDSGLADKLVQISSCTWRARGTSRNSRS